MIFKKKQTKTVIRQDDILLVRISDIDEDELAQIAEPVTVGLGEVTGHTHVVEEAVKMNGDELAWELFARTGAWQFDEKPKIAVTTPTFITHQEHGALPLLSGVWEITRQREYTPAKVRPVAD